MAGVHNTNRPTTGEGADPGSMARIAETLDRLDAAQGTDTRTKENADIQGLLNKILTHTRSSNDNNLRPLTTRIAIRTIGHYAFKVTAPAEYRIALRCLNNILVRSFPTRQMFVDEGYPKRLLDLMKKGDPEDELPTTSLLFYCLMRTSLDLGPSFEHDDLAGVMANNMYHHVGGPLPSPNDAASASAASLKLLAVVLTRYEAHAHRFQDFLKPLLDMFERVPVPTPPLQFPVTLLVVCIGAIPSRESDSFSKAVITKLLDILQIATATYVSPPGTERVLLPLFQAVLRAAQSGNPPGEAQTLVRQNLLPSKADRVRLAGGGGGRSLKQRVLRLTETADAELREAIMALYFELCDGDAAMLLHTVGSQRVMAFVDDKGIRLSEYARLWAERTGRVPPSSLSDGEKEDEGVDGLLTSLDRLNLANTNAAESRRADMRLLTDEADDEAGYYEDNEDYYDSEDDFDDEYDRDDEESGGGAVAAATTTATHEQAGSSADATHSDTK